MGTITYYILMASGLVSTTYGWGEKMCGDIGHPVECVKGARTASGDEFNPTVPSAAVAATTGLRMRSVLIGLRIPGGKCHHITINDKSNPRWIGDRGFDLSPAAVRLLTGEAYKYWSGVVEVCKTPQDPTLFRGLLIVPGHKIWS